MRLIVSLVAHAIAFIAVFALPKLGLDGAALVIGGLGIMIGGFALMWPDQAT